MAEQIKIVKLNCANCGGVLEIGADTDQFACGYCGSAQIVERRGGTVALRRVVDAVARVQVGTDRTAAELALVRLEKEIAGVNAEGQHALTSFDQNRSVDMQLLNFLLVITLGGTLVLGFVFMVSLIAESLTGATVSVILLGGAVAGLYFLIRHISSTSHRIKAARSEFWAPYAQRLQELDRLMKKTREMVD